MKNTIILIDLLNLTLDELNRICVEYGLDYQIMKHNKVNSGCQYNWIDTATNQIIAYTVNGLHDDSGNPKIFIMSEPLLKMTPVQPVKPKVRNKKKDPEKVVILETDIILDKISKYGISSLVQEELDYLKSLSN